MKKYSTSPDHRPHGPGTVIQVRLAQPKDAVALLLAAETGDAEAATLVRLLGESVARVANAQPGSEPQCPACDHPVRDPMGILICVATPVQERRSVVSVVCSECAYRPDLRQRLYCAYRAIWPDLRSIQPGPETMQ